MLNKSRILKIVKKVDDLINIELIKYGIFNNGVSFTLDDIKYSYLNKDEFKFCVKNDKKFPRSIRFNDPLTFATFLMRPFIVEAGLYKRKDLTLSFLELPEKYKVTIIAEMMKHDINISFVDEFYRGLLTSDNTVLEYKDMGFDKNMVSNIRKINARSISAKFLNLEFTIEEEIRKKNEKNKR